AILLHMDDQLPSSRHRRLASEYCFTMICGKGPRVESFMSKFRSRRLPERSFELLRHDMVQRPLATHFLVNRIGEGELSYLEQELPASLIRSVGKRCAKKPDAIRRLTKSLNSRWHTKTHSMAASILIAADTSWRPYPSKKGWRLTRGIFRDAEWSTLDLE